jgi:hypothetical protein
MDEDIKVGQGAKDSENDQSLHLAGLKGIQFPPSPKDDFTTPRRVEEVIAKVRKLKTGWID